MKPLKILSRVGIVLAALVIAFILFVACGDDSSDSRKETTAASVDSHVNSDYVSPSYAKKVALADDGTLSIERSQRSGNGSGCASDTWTILVYMCGSNLESDDGSASDDIAEMLDVEKADNIRFVIQTGGASKWENSNIDATKIQRFEINNKKLTLADEQELADMGKSETLSSFLRWGIEKYPAEHTALILWDHGGGSISGVCFDDLYDSDSLSLKDVDNALFDVFDLMGHNFDFIGFDACLMGTVESANILASYADYMIASQETVPGYGWNYRRLGNYIRKNPTANGGDIGKYFIDEYFDQYSDLKCANTLTMSVVDLSKIDAFTVAFNRFAHNLYSATEDTSRLSGVTRNILKADNFGGNNKAVGYTNMVDLKGLIESGSEYAQGADEALAALADAVVYSRGGSDHSAACGLSVYYPLEVSGSTELGTFGDVAISPYYLAYVDRSAYGMTHTGDTSGYDSSEIIDIWTASNSTDASGDAAYWNSYSYETTGESPLITFTSAPALDGEGNYSFTLTPDGLMNTSDVQALVYQVSNDSEDLIELGYSTDINMSVQDDLYATFSDNFNGRWFSLPDGQNLAVYVMTQTDEYIVFSSPITLNGEDTNLIFTYYLTEDTVGLNGTWDGIGENGMASRDYKTLYVGDVIVPKYDAVNIESEESVSYVGNEYTCVKDTHVAFRLLEDADYLYCFIIDDIYGDYYQTNAVYFNVENGKPYYYSEN